MTPSTPPFAKELRLRAGDKQCTSVTPSRECSRTKVQFNFVKEKCFEPCCLPDDHTHTHSRAVSCQNQPTANLGRIDAELLFHCRTGCDVRG